MTVAVILVLLIIIALLRFGVAAEYGADGFSAAVRAGFISIRVFPKKAPDKKKRDKKQKKQMKAERKKEKKKPKEKKPGDLKKYLDMLPAVKKLLRRVRRRLLVNSLTVHLVFCSDDPYKTAMLYGKGNAVIGAVLPAVGSAFRIRRKDIRTFTDFRGGKPQIYIKASISLAVWEAVYIVLAILPAFLTLGKSRKL